MEELLSSSVSLPSACLGSGVSEEGGIPQSTPGGADDPEEASSRLPIILSLRSGIELEQEQ